ncbi:MAG: hypothetical protein IJX08_05710 [Clostridia bacterium]|nr:hypothetical protein [Clostridia bacterium]
MGDMALEGTSLELTVNALVGSMLQKGYLNEKTNTVLLSVDSKDETDGNAIKEKLSEKISILFDTESINGSVISQTVSADDQELSDLASQYKMTLGKAKLIRTIVNMNPGSDFADYAELTVTELNAVMNQTAEDPKDESIYIGKEKALEIALNWRKVSADDLVCEPTIELVASRGTICYLIDVRTHSAVYIVYVDAFTGGIPSEGVNEPNFTAEEAWSFVCDQLGSEAEKATLLKQEFNDHTVSNFPMTYLFRFEIDDIEYAALVDALNGTVIRITKI